MGLLYRGGGEKLVWILGSSVFANAADFLCYGYSTWEEQNNIEISRLSMLTGCLTPEPHLHSTLEVGIPAGMSYWPQIESPHICLVEEELDKL